MDALRNPLDPLRKSGPDQQLELFNRFCREANGFSAEDVIGAALNVLVNGIRQSQATRVKADAALTEKLERARALLDNHYDANGRKRGVFPFHQIIRMEHFTDKERV